MIRTFRSRPLKALFERADASRIAADLVSRIVRLHGKPVRYSVHVNEPWCITFGRDGEDAVAVDLQNCR